MYSTIRWRWTGWPVRLRIYTFVIWRMVAREYMIPPFFTLIVRQRLHILQSQAGQFRSAGLRAVGGESCGAYESRRQCHSQNILSHKIFILYKSGFQLLTHIN